MVNIFGISGDHGPAGPSGPPGTDGVGGIKDVILWFPDMVREQIRKKLNVLTFLIETIPPAKDPDVEFSENKTVVKWKSSGEKKNMILTPVNQEKGSTLKTINPFRPPKRYGLVFNKKNQNMYHVENSRYMYLSRPDVNVLLTLTFLVGVQDDNIDDSEEFIVSDYRWAHKDKNPDLFRGVSVISKSSEKFDLYLHGARAENGAENRLKVGENIKKNLFYTLQVYWEKENKGFCLLYKDGKPLIDKTSFQYNDLPDSMTPAFYLGGFNASTDIEKVLKSKCFTGILSNLEIINTHHPSIPTELLEVIVQNQTVINDNWTQFTIKRKKLMEICNDREEQNEPSSLKRKKVT